MFQVRVPTHEDGSCLFWEFSTDYYDIGFGVYFEWTVEPSNAVTVHVSESSDEEDLEEEQQGLFNRGRNVMCEEQDFNVKYCSIFMGKKHQAKQKSICVYSTPPYCNYYPLS